MKSFSHIRIWELLGLHRAFVKLALLLDPILPGTKIDSRFSAAFTETPDRYNYELSSVCEIASAVRMH